MANLKERCKKLTEEDASQIKRYLEVAQYATCPGSHACWIVFPRLLKGYKYCNRGKVICPCNSPSGKKHVTKRAQKALDYYNERSC